MKKHKREYFQIKMRPDVHAYIKKVAKIRRRSIGAFIEDVMLDHAKTKASNDIEKEAQTTIKLVDKLRREVI